MQQANKIIYCDSGQHFIAESVCKARQAARREKRKTLAQKYCKNSCERYKKLEKDKQKIAKNMLSNILE